MRRLLAGLIVAVGLMTAWTSAVAVSPDHGNVGSENNFGPYNILDYLGHSTTYTCSQVHRQAVPGGWQEKETCTLPDGAATPKKPVTVDWTSRLAWGSDYYLALDGTWHYATNWSVTYMPSGQMVIVSFYATP